MPAHDWAWPAAYSKANWRINSRGMNWFHRMADCGTKWMLRMRLGLLFHSVCTPCCFEFCLATSGVARTKVLSISDGQFPVQSTLNKGDSTVPSYSLPTIAYSFHFKLLSWCCAQSRNPSYEIIEEVGLSWTWPFVGSLYHLVAPPSWSRHIAVVIGNPRCCLLWRETTIFSSFTVSKFRVPLLTKIKVAAGVRGRI